MNIRLTSYSFLYSFLFRYGRAGIKICPLKAIFIFRFLKNVNVRFSPDTYPDKL